MPEFLTLKSCDEARALLAGFPPVATETVALADALDRVLAEPLAAAEDLPPWPRATMDGYAVRAADTHGASDAVPAYLKLVGTVPMGGTFAGRVGAGEAVGISTGGVLPEGADAVVMIEYADRARAGEIEVRRGVAAGDHVLRPGEDAAAGEPLLAPGHRLRPQDLGLAAGLGRTRLTVHRRVRVALLSTGNEVVAADATPGPGQVRDVNQHALAAMVERSGALALRAGIVRDEAELWRNRLAELRAQADVIMLSGGSSVGVRDLAAEVVDALGAQVLFHGVHIRPGRPTLAARWGDQPLIGMPGWPVSSMIVFDVFMRPLLWRLGGERAAREVWPARRRARMARRQASVAGREDYLRVRLEQRDGATWAVPVPGGSASLTSVIRADGLVRIEAGCEGVGEGEDVEVLLYG